MSLRGILTNILLVLPLFFGAVARESAAIEKRNCPGLFGDMAKLVRVRDLDPADEMALEIIFRKAYEKPNEGLSVVEASYIREYGLEEPLEQVRKSGRELQRQRTLHRRIKTGVVAGSGGMVAAIVLPYLARKTQDLVAVEAFLNRQYGLALQGNDAKDLRFLERILECSMPRGTSLAETQGQERSAREVAARLVFEDAGAGAYELLQEVSKGSGALLCARTTQGKRQSFHRSGAEFLASIARKLSPEVLRSLGIQRILYGAPEKGTRGETGVSLSWWDDLVEPRIPPVAHYRLSKGEIRLNANAMAKYARGEPETWALSYGIAQALLQSKEGLPASAEFAMTINKASRHAETWMPTEISTVNIGHLVADHVACYLVDACREELKKRIPELDARIGTWIEKMKESHPSSAVRKLRDAGW